jgi:restriction endonuclease Mrr
MANENSILLLQQRIERRTIRYRKMVSHMAQLNATPSANEEFSEIVHKNLKKLWNDLENAKNELNFIINRPENILYSNKLIDREDNKSQIVLNEAKTELLKFLGMNPNYLYKLNSRVFEELIAKIFSDLGYSVELTPATHDKGRDIILTFESPIGKNVAYVECKKHSPDKPVGIDIVRGVYGVHCSDRVNQSLIVTTSYFTKDAYDYAKSLFFLISLKNYDHVVNWLKRYNSP